MISVELLAAHLYSASVDDLATVLCRFYNHETRLPPK